MRNTRERPFSGAFGIVTTLALAGTLALPSLLSAQGAGSVSGTVIDAVNGQALSGAQISIVGTEQGSLSDARGRFLILEVPSGPQNVRVTFLGYGTQTQEVNVTAGVTATVAFQLALSAISLDEIVVTGTAGAVEQRKVGTSMASINVNQVQENIPVQDFGSILAGRIAGVRSIGVAGGVGVAKQLTVRGTASFGLDQRPVIYIDGVRVDSYHGEWGGLGGTACCSFSGGAGEDRLGDLNPEDIDRVEVLKGPAAATLYGSEASNGVIQIFTKRGRSNSPPQFTTNIVTGFNRLRENLSTDLNPEFVGPDGLRAWDANKTLIENGPVLSADLTAQGGGSDVTYFVSGGYNFEEGSVTPNSMKRGNMRLNMRWVANSKWTFAINSAYSQNDILSLQSGNNWMSLLGNAVLGNPRKATEERPYGEPWLAVADIKKVDTHDAAARWTGGLTATYNPVSWFTNKVTFGMDNVDEEKSRLMPFGSYYTYVGTDGERNLGFRRARTVTADYLGSIEIPEFGGVQQDLSFGAQGFWSSDKRNMAIGQGYAGPGVTTVGGAALTFGSESFTETVNVGMFVQDRFSYADKLFATVGLRVDGNSAFGENYGLKAYPKFDVAYQISQEGFLPSFISTMKLRGAIGQAGKFPGAFDQFQTYSPQTVLDDVAGVSPNNPGNADLKPESTMEIEGGFDAGLFNDRLGVVFTYYRAKTTDALLSINKPPSEGFSSSRQENVGEILNKGWEATVNFAPINKPGLRWSVDLNLDRNSNEILALGDQAVPQAYLVSDGKGGFKEISVMYLGGHEIGYSIGAMWSRAIDGYDAATNKHTRTSLSAYQGQRMPKWSGSFANTLSFGDFRLYGLVSTEQGAVFDNGDRPYRMRQGAGSEWLGLFDFENRDADGNPVPTMASDSLLNYFTLVSAYDSRDHIRIREASLSYSVPATLSSRLGLGRTVLTLSGQNLWWWDDCNCMDPNMQYAAGSSTSSSGFLAMPQGRKFLFSVRTGFGG